MNIYSIVSGIIVLFIIAIYLFIWISKSIKNKVRITIYISASLLLISGVLVLTAIISNSSNPYEMFYNVDMKNNTKLNIDIFFKANRNYLVYEDQSEVMYYYGEEDVVTHYSNLYHPIYLKEYEDIYVVVFSTDKDKKIEYNRFTIVDCQLLDHKEDKLLVIERNTGEIFSIYDYYLVSKTINLESITLNSNKLLSYEVFLDHEEGISAVYGFFIDNENKEYYHPYYSIANTPDIALTHIHFYSEGDPSEITNYVITSKYIIWTDSYGEAYGYYFSGHQSIQYTAISNEIIDNSFIKQGYFAEKNGEIYYIGVTNDKDTVKGTTGYSIYRMVNGTFSEEVTRLTYSDILEDIGVIDNWILQIPN